MFKTHSLLADPTGLLKTPPENNRKKTKVRKSTKKSKPFKSQQKGEKTENQHKKSTQKLREKKEQKSGRTLVKGPLFAKPEGFKKH